MGAMGGGEPSWQGRGFYSSKMEGVRKKLKTLQILEADKKGVRAELFTCTKK